MASNAAAATMSAADSEEQTPVHSFHGPTDGIAKLEPITQKSGTEPRLDTDSESKSAPIKGPAVPAAAASKTKPPPPLKRSLAGSRLRGALLKVKDSVHVKRKYLVASEEAQRAVQAEKETLKLQGQLAKSQLDITKIALAALDDKRNRDATDWVVRYNQFCGRFKDMVTDAAWFKNFVTIAIFIAGINVGAQTYSLPAKWENFFSTLDDIVLGVFVVECVVTIFAEGTRPWRYYFDAWNVFDFLVVVASFLPFGSGQIAILRLMRLLRLLKLVKALPKLRILVIGLLMSFQSIGYVMLMVFLLFYLWAVMGVLFLAENDPVNFGNLHLAFLALWRAATGDDWTDMMYTAFWGCKSNIYGGGADYGGRSELCHDDVNPLGMIFPTIYFIVFQVIASMMLINMFIGAILMSVEEAKEDIENVEAMHVLISKATKLQMVKRLGILTSAQASNPFVRVTLGEGVFKTTRRRKTQNPEWDENLEIVKFQQLKASEMQIQVLDWDRLGRDVLIGEVKINTASIPFNKAVRFRAALTDANGDESGGELYFSIRKEVTGAIPTDVYDPESKLQTIANRLSFATRELEDLEAAIKKRKKHRDKATKVSLLSRMKSFKSIRSIASLASRNSRKSDNSDSTAQVTTHSRTRLMAATTVTPNHHTYGFKNHANHAPITATPGSPHPAYQLLHHAESAASLLGGRDSTPEPALDSPLRGGDTA